VTSPNVVWYQGTPRERRWSAVGAAGATVWFTGRPASGKSTLAAALEAALLDEGRSAYLLDGDNLRHGINGNLGFDRAARRENVRRTAHVARLLADSGAVALVSVVSPYAADRKLARAIHAADGLPFVEVHVATPLADFTGVDSPYEPPQHPDLEIVPDLPMEEHVEQLLGVLAGLES